MLKGHAAALARRLRATTGTPVENPRVMGLTLATLFFLGGSVGTISLLLPHPEGFNDGALWTNIAISFVAAAGLAVLAGRLPPWSLQIALLGGMLLVTRAVYYSDQPSGFYALWYLWVGLYAFFFFGRGWGLVHTVTIALAYAWVLSEIPHDAVLARWTMMVTTLVVAGGLIDAFVLRVRRTAAEAESRARNLAAVDSVAHDLARATDAASLGPAICDAVREVSAAQGVSLWQPGSGGAGLVCTASTDGELDGAVVPLIGPASATVSVFTSGSPLFVPDVVGNPVVNKALAERTHARTGMFQPVIREGVPIGVLVLYWLERVTSLDPDLDQIVKLLAAEASIVIERGELLERLERVARTDDLTGLPNRRAWDEELVREIARAERDGSLLCVAMLDLDHFKRYNDEHGHQAGDRLLKEATAAWQVRLRLTDVLARYGGEEFTLALPGCDPQAALTLIERLRSATPEGQTVSAGLAHWLDGESADSLVGRADGALYEAKRAGRDRIVSAAAVPG